MSREIDIMRALRYLRRGIAERRPTGFTHIEADQLNRKLARAVGDLEDALKMFSYADDRRKEILDRYGKS